MTETIEAIQTRGSFKLPHIVFIAIENNYV